MRSSSNPARSLYQQPHPTPSPSQKSTPHSGDQLHPQLLCTEAKRRSQGSSCPGTSTHDPFFTRGKGRIGLLISFASRTSSVLFYFHSLLPSTVTCHHDALHAARELRVSFCSSSRPSPARKGVEVPNPRRRHGATKPDDRPSCGCFRNSRRYGRWSCWRPLVGRHQSQRRG